MTDDELQVIQNIIETQKRHANIFKNMMQQIDAHAAMLSAAFAVMDDEQLAKVLTVANKIKKDPKAVDMPILALEIEDIESLILTSKELMQ